MTKFNKIIASVIVMVQILYFTLDIKYCEAQWLQTNGPFRGNLVCLAISGQNIFAGTEYNGVSLSTNYGNNWITVNNGLTNLQFLSITIKDNTVFSGTYEGVFRSTDNGGNWVPSGLSGEWVRGFAITGVSIFAVTEFGGVFLSTNNGESWSDLNVDSTYRYFLSIVVSGNNIFAGTYHGIYRSTNSGKNWNSVNNGLLGQFVFSLIISGNNIFAGTDNGVFISANYGENWIAAGLQGKHIYSLIDFGENVFAGSNEGVFMSSNIGDSWLNKNQGLSYPSVYTLTKGGDYIFTGSGDQSVWKRSLTEITEIKQISGNLIVSFSLKQNYPNPFNPNTNLEFEISKLEFITLKVYNMLGKEISILVNEKLNQGKYKVEFDGSSLPSGLYFYKITAGEFTDTKSMLLIK